MARRYVVAGSTGQSVDVFLQDRTSGDGVITMTTDKVKAAYRIGSTGPVTTFALVGENTTVPWASGGWAEASSVNMPGIYRLDMPDASLATTPSVTFFLQCSTAGQNFIPVALDVQTVSSIGTDNPVTAVRIGPVNSAVALTSRDIGASVLLSSGTGAGQIVLTSGVVNANMIQLAGQAQTSRDIGASVLLSSGTGTGQIVLTAGVPDVNVVKLAGQSQTSRDIGASVLLSSGTGAGQIVLSAGIVSANVTQFGGSNLTQAGGRPEVNMTHVAGQTQTSRDLGASVLLSSGTGTGQIILTAGVVSASATTVVGNVIADCVLNRDMSAGVDSGSSAFRTPRQALRFLRNKWSIAGSTLTVYAEDDTSASWTAALTTNSAADPISAVDPA